MSSILKPCPFCGAPAQIKKLSGRYAAECTKKCVGTRIFVNKDKAIEVWNRRDSKGPKVGTWLGTVCTVCGESTSFYYDCDYCPQCGAKMEAGA